MKTKTSSPRQALFAALASLSLLAPVNTRAQTLAWDPDVDSNNGANGGTGTWNAANLNWFDGAVYIAWPNVANQNVATFGGTAGTVTVDRGGATTQVDGLEFTVGGYTLNANAAGDSITLGGTNALSVTAATGTTVINNAIVLNSASTFNNDSSGALTLGGSLTGAFNLIKTGSGTMNMTAASTRTGSGSTTQIDGGVLSVQHATALGTSGTANQLTATVNNGGTLEVMGNITLDNGVGITLNHGGTIRSNGANTINGRILVSTAVGANDVTLSTVNGSDLLILGNGNNDISGGNGTDDTIRIAGPGAIRLNNASNYVGNWSLDAGITQLGSSSSFGGTASSTVTLKTGATLSPRLAGNSTFTANPITISGTGTATVLADRSSTGTGVSYTFGALSIGANQQLDVTNTSAFTGGGPSVSFSGTTVTGAAVFNVNLGAGGATSMSLNPGAMNLSADATFQGTGRITQSGGFNLNGAVRTLTFNNSSVGGTSTIGGAFTGSGGTLRLAGSGAVTVNALTDATGNSQAVEVNSTTGGVYTFSSGSTYTGGFMLTSGTALTSSATSLGAGTITFAGGTFAIPNNDTSTLYTNTLNITGPVTFGTPGLNALVGFSGASQSISNSPTITVESNGNSRGVRFITNPMQLNSNASFVGTGNMPLVQFGGGFDLRGDNRILTFNNTTTSTIGGDLIDSVGTGRSLTLAGSGVVTINTMSAFNNGTRLIIDGVSARPGGQTVLPDFITINSGELDVRTNFDVAGIVGSGGNVVNSDGSNRVLTLTGSGNYVYDGNIAPITTSRIVLVKNGAGTQTLNGVNTYTGNTTINEGTLIINGSLANTAVTIAANGTLGGSGSIAGTIGGAGLVSAGNSPGILTVGQVNPTGGLDFPFEFTQLGAPNWSNPTASGNDVVRITNADAFTAALTSANELNYYFDSVGTFQGSFFSTQNITADLANATHNYFLWNGSNYVSWDTSLVTRSVVGATADFGAGDVSGFTQEFTVAIPEPGTLVLVGVALLSMVALRRRKH